MLKNSKININLNDKNKASSSMRAKNNAQIRKNWKLLKGMDCGTCSNECGAGLGVCFQMLFTNRVLQLENRGGKSDMLFEVNASEQERTVPIEVYQQLLQAFADYKAGQTSDQTPAPDKTEKTKEKSAEDGDMRADEPKKAEKTPSKTLSDEPAKENVEKSPGKKTKFPPIPPIEKDPFDSINAGSKKKADEPQQLSVDDYDELNDAPIPEFLKD